MQHFNLGICGGFAASCVRLDDPCITRHRLKAIEVAILRFSVYGLEHSGDYARNSDRHRPTDLIIWFRFWCFEDLHRNGRRAPPGMVSGGKRLGRIRVYFS